jgi:DNA topoisomerase-1
MSKKALVVVESPSKAKTIQKYLGRDYIVKASVGHIKDLPKSKLGVDPKTFEPDYQIIPAKTKVIEELKKAAEKVPHLYLATDPDREGEAIAWHIQEVLKARGRKIERVLFNSITKPAILEAIKNPTQLDESKYAAQQARRVLDRLVGYKISPLLWDKVRRGISAGRVQSVALRLVVDREAEIKKFKAEEYWKIAGDFTKDGVTFTANLFKINAEDPVIPNKAAAQEILTGVEKSDWRVSALDQKERSRKPQPPFITSRLQQDAARKLGFSAKKTMALAQQLYEGIDLKELGTHGLITYMRTDSVRVEPTAIDGVRGFIRTEYGKEFLPSEPNQYKSKKSAQDAHEAIRPTTLEFPPEKLQPLLERDVFRLYQLIWNRFVASQMNPAIYDQSSVDVKGSDARKNEFQFRATGSVIKFPGFMRVYQEAEEATSPDGEKADAASPQSSQTSSSENEERALKLPPLIIGDSVKNTRMTPTQHFTQPPGRYSDASLIRDLEEKGIGRPSTYATILSNLQDREYVEKREGRYYPSELGTVVTELLIQAFPNILNAEFTASMETHLDEIEEGTQKYKKIMTDFWKPFEKTLEAAKLQMKNIKQQEVPTDIQCDKCKNNYVIKWGKLGSFLACSNYPECKNTQDFKKDSAGRIQVIPKEYSDKKCEKCEKPMLVKSGKFGKFLACSDYPTCKSTQAIGIGIHCPLCKTGEMTQKQSRYKRLFYSCMTWPKCNYAVWDKPVEKPCPQCQWPILTEKVTKKSGLVHKCPQKECGYVEVIDPNAGKEPPPEQDEGSVNSDSNTAVVA